MSGKKFERPIFDNPFLNITQNQDGTVTRSPMIKNTPNSDPNSVLSKDVTLDATKKTWMRLYIPKNASLMESKLPVIVYYHGGGFVFFNADSSLFDVFCQELSVSVGAMVISLEYRLAPEHRLPAAYDDGIDTFHWLKSTRDEWVEKYADLSNCYICGCSAGGNLTYQVGLRIASHPSDFEPIRVKGLILQQPYFSGTRRTASEEKLKDDGLLPLHAIDRMFDLSLPEGVDHDHEYCNPLVNGGSKNVELGWRVLVTGCYDDRCVYGFG